MKKLISKIEKLKLIILFLNRRIDFEINNYQIDVAKARILHGIASNL